jgi:hypothetical protein
LISSRASSAALLDDAREAIHEQTKASPGQTAARLDDDEKASPGEGSPLSEEIPHGEREELNALLDL